MKKLLKSIWDYLTEKVHITFTPSSPSRSVKRIRIRRVYPIILVLLIITTIWGLAYLYKHYEYNYFAADNKLQELRGVKADNKELKNELISLTKDTEELRQAMINLKDYNRNIKNMIDIEEDEVKQEESEENVDMKLRTIVSYNNNLFQQGIPMGGGDFRLQYQNPDDLIKSMQHNVSVVRKEIPEQRQELHNLEASVKEYNAEMAATPTIWPVADKGKGYISSNFGWRNDPSTAVREFHEGLDIAVWYNTPVLATAYGRIKYAGWCSGYGWTVKIDHGFGFKTIYAHLNRIKVKKGEKVKRGQVVALSGNSGRSTGPHLHYEVRVNNIPKNPRDYIGR